MKQSKAEEASTFGFLVVVIRLMSDSSKQEESQDTEGFGRLV